MKRAQFIILAVVSVFILTKSTVYGTTLEELADRVEKLERENTKLKQALSQTDEKIEATVETVELSISQKGDLFAKTHIGGYGELHYNNLVGSGGASDKSEIDFHRFVLFFSHDFSDSIKFNSELEIEHSISGDDQPGEVELEQAYLDFLFDDRFNMRGGLFLLPVGILNEVHEPTSFYGVERNPVEKNIIPTTWWEGGLGAFGEFLPGLSYDLFLHSGLETSGPNYSIRGGRQKVAEALADNLAATARLRWNVLPGVEVAASYQLQDDITQGNDELAGRADMFEAHAILSKWDFTLKALYAVWNLDGAGPKASGSDEQFGYYIEPSYKLTSSLGIFARYNRWDNRAGADSNAEKTQWDIGINYWPHPNVVIKADYQIQDNEDNRNQDGFNIGLGYHF